MSDADKIKVSWDEIGGKDTPPASNDSHSNGFLVCPRCLQAYPSETPHSTYTCRFCHHEWMPPINSLGDIYFVPFDEISVSLTEAGGEEFFLRTFPITIGRDSEFRALQHNVAVSRHHCVIDFDRTRGTFIVTPYKTGGGTYLNGQSLQAGIAHDFFPDDSFVISGVVLTLHCRLNKEQPNESVKFHRPSDDIRLVNRQSIGYIDVAISGESTFQNERTSHSVAAISYNGDLNIWTLLAIERKHIRINGASFIEQRLVGGENIQIGDNAFVFNSENSSFEATAPEKGVGIEIIHLSVGYQEKVVLGDISCHIPKGKLTAILGQSGCGKSTLIKVLSGQKQQISGEILVDGAKNHYSQWAEKHLSLVPQFDVIHPDLTVKQCVEYAADIRIGKKANSNLKRTIVEKVIRDAGLTGFSNSYISELSGGQRKRVNIAVEAVGHPEVLLLDEPTTGLDYATEKQIIAGLRQMSRQGETVVFVTHSLSTIEAADHVIVLKTSNSGSRVAAEGAPSEVQKAIGVESWQALYTRIDSANRGNGNIDIIRPEAYRAPGMSALFSRYLMIWINSPVSSIALLFGLPLLLGIMIRFAVSIDAPLGTDRLIFGLVAMFWMGMNQTVREIIKEKDIFIQEHAHHVSSVAYLSSKIFFFLIVTFFQALLMTLPILWLNVNSDDFFLKFGQLTCSFGDVLPMMWFAGLIGCTLGLFFSSLSLFIKKQGEIAAVLFAVIATLPQFLFSAKVLPDGLAKPLKPEHFYQFICWHENAPVAEILSYFTFSRYLFLPLDAISSGQATAIITKSFIFNCGILGMATICLVIATWVSLEFLSLIAKK